jgi:hypothetical protein
MSEPGAVDNPVSNGALVEAMAAVAAQDDRQTRAFFFELLLDSALYALTPEAQGTGVITIRPGESVQLVTLTHADGVVLPLFTDEAAIVRFHPDGAAWVVLPAQPLFQMAATNQIARVAINPGSPTGAAFSRREIEALARGNLPLGGTEVARSGTDVRLGRPATAPEPELVAAMQAAMEPRDAVVGAWYFLLQQGDNPPTMAAALELAAGLDGDEERTTMQAVVDDAGRRAAGLSSYLFLVADEPLKAQMVAGQGVEFFRREPTA